MLDKTLAGSFKLFRVLGITVYLHYLWFVLIVFHVMYRRGVGVYSHWGWNLAEILSLFLIVLLHEFGHALACRSVGGRADTILLWPLGGIAFVQAPHRPGANLWSIAAGPLVNVLLVPVTFLAVYTAQMPGVDASDDLVSLLVSIAIMNMAILVFNLLPIYPLDGGQIMQSILWYFVGFARALRFVAVVGVIAAVLIGAAAIWQGEYFMLILTLFIGWQSVRGYKIARFVAAREEQQRLTQGGSIQ